MKSIFFVHLHKCGGTTANAALNKMFRESFIYQIDGKRYEDSAREFMNLPDIHRNKYLLIKGHQFFGLHNYIKNDFSYATILREPKSRLISLYNYSFRSQALNFHEELVKQNLNFEQFIKSGMARTADNGMTRFISGIDWNEVPYGECNEAVLEKAKSNLDHYFDFIGITEEFDASLMLMKIIYRLSSYPIYLPKNVTESLNSEIAQKDIIKKNNVSENVFFKLKKYYEYDEVIYNYAKKKYLLLKEKHIIGLSKELNRFNQLQKIERIKSKGYEIKHSIYQKFMNSWHKRD